MSAVVPGGFTLAGGRGNAGSEGALLCNDVLALTASGSKVWSWFVTSIELDERVASAIFTAWGWRGERDGRRRTRSALAPRRVGETRPFQR